MILERTVSGIQDVSLRFRRFPANCTCALDGKDRIRSFHL